MNTRTIAVIAVFAAITIVLNLSPVKFPAPYAPFLYYQIWEIPMVAALLLFGGIVGLLISLTNTALLIAVFPGALPTGPLYNLAAVLSMFLGVGLMKILLKKYAVKNYVIVGASLTAAGVILRTVTMVIVNWICLRYPPPIGYGLPEEAIIATIPLIAVFNITFALYTVPVGYSLAKAVESYIKINK